MVSLYMTQQLTAAQSVSIAEAVTMLIHLDISIRSGDWGDTEIDNITYCVASLVQNFVGSSDFLRHQFAESGLIDATKRRIQALESVKKNLEN